MKITRKNDIVLIRFEPPLLEKLESEETLCSINFVLFWILLYVNKYLISERYV